MSSNSFKDNVADKMFAYNIFKMKIRFGIK